MASYPAAPVVFPPRSDGTVDFAAYTNGLQAEIAALEAALLGTVPHPLTAAQALRLTAQGSPGQIAADQHNYAPPGLASLFQLRLQADAARSITGLAAQPVGRVLALSNVGAFPITLTHDDAASAAANRFALPSAAPYTLGPHAGAVLIYDTDSRWRPVGWTPPTVVVVPNVVVDVPYSAANFTATVGTWTVEAGDQLTFAYILDGKKMTVWLELISTTISTTQASPVKVKIPGGKVAARNTRITFHSVNNGPHAQGVVVVTAGGTTMDFYAGPVTAGSVGTWVAQTNLAYLLGQITFPVQ